MNTEVDPGIYNRYLESVGDAAFPHPIKLVRGQSHGAQSDFNFDGILDLNNVFVPNSRERIHLVVNPTDAAGKDFADLVRKVMPGIERAVKGVVEVWVAGIAAETGNLNTATAALGFGVIDITGGMNDSIWGAKQWMDDQQKEAKQAQQEAEQSKKDDQQDQKIQDLQQQQDQQDKQQKDEPEEDGGQNQDTTLPDDVIWVTPNPDSDTGGSGANLPPGTIHPHGTGPAGRPKRPDEMPNPDSDTGPPSPAALPQMPMDLSAWVVVPLFLGNRMFTGAGGVAQFENPSSPNGFVAYFRLDGSFH